MAVPLDKGFKIIIITTAPVNLLLNQTFFVLIEIFFLKKGSSTLSGDLTQCLSINIKNLYVIKSTS